ncbi:MAG TPA: hypothetical protein VI386_09340 [Candidatus Sulfotelmatobacter sp.]|jgi:hypothetical protein
MKRKAAQSKQNSTEHPSESSFSSRNAGQGLLYEEATGKTIDFIRYAEQSSGWAAFEIRFTDGTFLFIEPVPQVQFRLRLLKASKGNVKTVREYGVTG